MPSNGLKQIMPFLRDHLNETLWHMGWVQHHLHDYDDCKTMEIQMHRMHVQRGWFVWCHHLLHKVLKIWPLLTPN